VALVPPRRGRYGHLSIPDNEGLAELIAGKSPVSGEAGCRAAHLWVRDDVSPDPQASIDSLRRDVPALGIEDILVDGVSWHGIEAKKTTCLTL
jgi:hypothetical protein